MVTHQIGLNSNWNWNQSYWDLLTARIFHQHFNVALTGRKRFDGKIGWCSDNGAGRFNSRTVSTDSIDRHAQIKKFELFDNSNQIETCSHLRRKQIHAVNKAEVWHLWLSVAIETALKMSGDEHLKCISFKMFFVFVGCALMCLSF